MFKKVLVANRGEIAVRIIAACRQLAISTVVVYSTADEQAQFVQMADEAICVGPASAQESYLNREAILMAAQITGSDAIHPGYGFLSEDPLFATMVAECGLTWIGPSPDQIQRYADKERSRELAQKRGVPTIPGSGLITDDRQIKPAAEELGFPVLLKASFGGGGKGIRVAHDEQELSQIIAVVRQESGASFGSSPLYLERDLQNARHIEVQVLGLNEQIIILGDRNCSIQLHRQKVVEESPANLTIEQRERLYQAVHRLLDQSGNESLGTVEFLQVGEEFYFLEMNTRLQVEHGVTEETTGIDIVQTQIVVAAGQPELVKVGDAQVHAIEARINATAPGQLVELEWPATRIETGYAAGNQIAPYYDALVGKIIVTASTRAQAVQKLRQALKQTKITGVPTNLAAVEQLVASPVFIQGTYDIRTYQNLLDGC